MKQIFYFAYGSNMSRDRLEHRVGKVVKMGLYTLQNYKLVFDTGGWNAYANIVPSTGDQVEGVLYQLRDSQISTLDLHEGWPGLYQKFFFLDGGEIVFGYWTPPSSDYKARKDAKPSLQYINFLLDGAAENGLKMTYKTILDYKIKNFKLKGGSKHKPL